MYTTTVMWGPRNFLSLGGACHLLRKLGNPALFCFVAFVLYVHSENECHWDVRCEGDLVSFGYVASVLSGSLSPC
jgi:hypothetical protein